MKDDVNNGDDESLDNLDAERAELERMAHAAQMGEPVDAGEGATDKNADHGGASNSGKAAPDPAAKEDGAAKEKGTKTTEATSVGKTGTDDEAKPDEAKKSKYQRERERQEQSWKKLEEEKRQVREEKQRLEAEKQRLEQERQNAKPRGPKELTADNLEQLAKVYEQEGDLDKAKRAKELAVEKRAEEKRQAEQERQTALETHKAKWVQESEAVSKEMPELKNPESPLSKEVLGLLRNPEYATLLARHPSGFRYAAEIGQLRLAAASVPELQKKVAEQKAEIERLTKLTAVGGTPLSARGAAKSFDEMSEAEQRTEIERMAMEQDGFR